jgi:hypothetical protein
MLKFGSMIMLALLSIQMTQAQYWQQKADYELQIDFDAESHRFSGYEKIIYTNNSPDTLNRVFYHLYFNAFQPGSMMDQRARWIRDPDPRIGNRISKLSEEEIGFHKVKKLLQDEARLKYQIQGTILEVQLANPVLPGASTVLEMWFDSQVPVQIRRSGRYNEEGIAYSMAQWYPKLAEYEHMGWHANPYIAREFHGVWGDYDVHIYIDEEFTVAGTGVLQNPTQVGHGYVDAQDAKPVPIEGRLHWHFRAENVHDFVWAADPNYHHTKFVRDDGVILHFFYQKGSETASWEELPRIADMAMTFANENYGKYPYPQYSVIQAGDGGMEYPMATLITGHRGLRSLVGVFAHELMHSWYQGVLANNESLYYWMDEGFANYTDQEIMNYLAAEGVIPGLKPRINPHEGSLKSYTEFAQTGLEEPMCTHADHFNTNIAYGRAAYTKGEVFLEQIRYVIGDDLFDRLLKAYFEQWKFKHPGPNDFMRVVEKMSEMELDWLYEYIVLSTKRIDYAVVSLEDIKNKTILTLARYGEVPMPVDVAVRYTNGKIEYYTIPLEIMRGAKERENNTTYTIADDWPWTQLTYELELPRSAKKIESVEIDPSGRMADMDRKNNEWYPSS